MSSATLSIYYEKCPKNLLTKEETLILIEQIQQFKCLVGPAYRTDIQRYKNATEKLILHNMGLVVRLTGKYLGRGADQDDLISEGLMSIIHAAEKFDPLKDIYFSTYVTYWILAAIRKYIADKGRIIRIPIYIQNIKSKWEKAKKILTADLGREPENKEIQRYLHLTDQQVERIQYTNNKNHLSLHQLQKDSYGQEFIDYLEDKKQIKSSQLDDIKEDMKCLPQRSQTIIIQHYIEGKKFDEIGAELKLTKQRVQQIENESLNKLRQRYSA